MRYGANKKTIILVGTFLEVGIGTKATALGRCRTSVVANFDFVGGDMKVATINIRSVKLHTPEPLCLATGGDGGERSAAATTTTIGDTTITDTVFVQGFEVPAPHLLNDEAFKVVVAHPMAETPDRPLSPLTEAGGSVVGAVLAHVIDASTVEMPPHPPLPQFLPLLRFLPVTLPPPPLPHIPSPCTPLTQRRSSGERPATRSHSKGEKADCCGLTARLRDRKSVVNVR